MTYRWLSITDCIRVGSIAGEDSLSLATAMSWETWETGFVAEVQIVSDRRFDVRIDAFPFLYALMDASAKLISDRNFHVEIGEGLRLHGLHESRDVALRISFEAGSRNDTLLEKSLSLGNASLFLSLKAAELVQSLEKIGVDVELYLLTFPPGTEVHRFR